MTTLAAPVRWAQRKDKLYLTVELRDIKNEKINWVSPSELQFSGESDNKNYECHLNFFGELNIEESKWNKSGLHLQFILEKKEEGPYWKRLTKEDKKFQNIAFDWDKYVDEDEEEEEGKKGLEGWDPEQMRGFDQGEDSDDDEGEGEEGNLGDLDQEEEIPTNKADMEEEKKE